MPNTILCLNHRLFIRVRRRQTAPACNFKSYEKFSKLFHLFCDISELNYRFWPPPVSGFLFRSRQKIVCTVQSINRDRREREITRNYCRPVGNPGDENFGSVFAH